MATLPSLYKHGKLVEETRRLIEETSARAARKSCFCYLETLSGAKRSIVFSTHEMARAQERKTVQDRVEVLRHEVKKMGRANVAHIRQSRPESGLGFQAKVLETLYHVPSLLVQF